MTLYRLMFGALAAISYSQTPIASLFFLSMALFFERKQNELNPNN